MHIEVMKQMKVYLQERKAALAERKELQGYIAKEQALLEGNLFVHSVTLCLVLLHSTNTTSVLLVNDTEAKETTPEKDMMRDMQNLLNSERAEPSHDLEELRLLAPENAEFKHRNAVLTRRNSSLHAQLEEGAAHVALINRAVNFMF